MFCNTYILTSGPILESSHLCCCCLIVISPHKHTHTHTHTHTHEAARAREDTDVLVFATFISKKTKKSYRPAAPHQADVRPSVCLCNSNSQSRSTSNDFFTYPKLTINRRLHSIEHKCYYIFSENSHLCFFFVCFFVDLATHTHTHTHHIDTGPRHE